MAVKAIPDGYHSVTAYLIVNGAASALDFYKEAFGATELFRMAMPGGKIGHAEFMVGDSPVMIADECPEMGFRGPKALGGTPVSLLIYVDDVDPRFGQALSAGATVLKPLQD